MSDVIKAESSGTTVTRPFTEKGQPQILTSTRFIQDQRKVDLVMPKRLCTFDKMAEDDAVANSIDVTNILVTNAIHHGEFVSKSGTPSSKIAADFLNYAIRNLSSGTWLESVNNSVTDLQYGFSLQNIVAETRKTGPFAGAKVLKKLAPRDQKSIFGWVWDKKLRNLKGFVQKPNRVQLREPKAKEFESGILLSSISNGLLRPFHPFISTQQMLHFRHNPTNNNPQGDSPLTHIYDAWLEKKLVERYEVVGVSKDLGGAVVLRVPSELVERANDPVTYPNEAAEYTQLQKDAGALHAGESSFIVLTSDVDEVTKTPLFDFELKGIDGGGKQYNTSDIIDQKRKSIYNMFGTGFLLTGQSGHGSNALSSNQMTTHDYYVDRSIMWKEDVINNQLAPRLLAINNIKLDWKDMPVFKAADPSKPDLDIISKVIQRTKSVGGMTPEALEKLYKDAGWPTEGIEDLSFDDGDTSRGGESGGTSGTGSSQGGKSGGSNTNNSVTKQLVVYGDKLIDIITDKVINIDQLTEDGDYR
jgi:hypothetical protein